jgi:hypothetical protein
MPRPKRRGGRRLPRRANSRLFERGIGPDPGPRPRNPKQLGGDRGRGPAAVAVGACQRKRDRGSDKYSPTLDLDGGGNASCSTAGPSPVVGPGSGHCPRSAGHRARLSQPAWGSATAAVAPGVPVTPAAVSASFGPGRPRPDRSGHRGPPRLVCAPNVHWGGSTSLLWEDMRWVASLPARVFVPPPNPPAGGFPPFRPPRGKRGVGSLSRSASAHPGVARFARHRPAVRTRKMPLHGRAFLPPRGPDGRGPRPRMASTRLP